MQLEKTLTRICDICDQRSALAAKDRTLMSCKLYSCHAGGVFIPTLVSVVALISEFESFTHHDLIVSDEDEPVVVSGYLFVFVI